ncbi:hypothetical protein YB2330_002199 [Saitoella coloradoensis]
MPNLKISKFRQFLGEKLGQEEKKTIQTDVFQALEAEMVLRREGTETLLKHTELYLRNISKTKVGDGEGGNKEKDKAMPVELLGKAFVGHAGMFEEGSAYGTALSLLGPALINIAAHQSYLCASTDILQKSFQGHLDLHATLHKLQSKLEGRRLAYDAAKSRAYKARKEDARIEEEVIAAESKWAETSDAVEECMERIREGEGEMLRALTGFLESGREFYGRCLGEVEGVRENWVCEVDQNLPSVTLSDGSMKETKEKERPKIVSRITTGTMGTTNEKQTNGYGTLSSSPPSMSMLPTPTPTTSTVPRPAPMQRSKTAPLPPPGPPSSTGDTPILRCKFSHEPQDAEELELSEGDLIVMVKEVSQSWAIGYLLDTDGGRGREGWFPREFCEVVEKDGTSVGGGRERSWTVSSRRSTREAEVNGRSRSGTVSSRRSNYVDNEPSAAETRSRRGTVTSVHSSRVSATAYAEEPEEAADEDVFADVKFGGDREGESESPFTDTTPTGTIGRSAKKSPPPPPPPSRSTKPGMAMGRQGSVDGFYATPSVSTHSLNDSSSTTTVTATTNGRSRKSSLSDVLSRSRKASTASMKQSQVQEEKVGLLVAECGECGCDEFQANVFKKGQCNNCFHTH